MRTFLVVSLLTALAIPGVLSAQGGDSSKQEQVEKEFAKMQILRKELEAIRVQAEAHLGEVIISHEKVRDYSNKLMRISCTRNTARIVRELTYTKEELDDIRTTFKGADTERLLKVAKSLSGTNGSLVQMLRKALDSCSISPPAVINLNRT